MLSSGTRHYGFAGLLSGCYVLGSVPGTPLLGTLVDRYGQRRVLLPTVALHACAAATLIALFEFDAPDWALPVPAVVLGLSFVSVGSLVRARWSFVLHDRGQLSTAFSLESALDEVVFIVGPLIATLLATHADPVLVIVLGAGLIVAGGVGLAAQRATQPPPHPRVRVDHWGALHARGLVALTLAATATGGIFAGAEVSIVAFCSGRGARGASGVVLACLALGSLVAALAYGVRTWRASILARYRVQSVILGVAPILFLAAGSVPVLAVCTFVIGLSIAPALITAFGLVERVSEPGALTAALAWLNTGLNLGFGLASMSVGPVADAHGARASFVVAIGAGLVSALAAWAVYRRISGSVGALDRLDGATADARRPAEPPVPRGN
jgi:MFS family permease